MPPLHAHKSSAASVAARAAATPKAGGLRTFDVTLMALIVVVAVAIALGVAGVF